MPDITQEIGNITFNPDGLYITETADGKYVKIADGRMTWHAVPTIAATNDISIQTQTELYRLREEINNVQKRLYEIISSHTSIDISEEEFMRLLKGNN